ncbi:dTDP-4-dehydrorhamnose reductase [Agrobacterium rosae]
MRIAVTGNQGQVVTSILERAEQRSAEIIALGRPRLDLSNPVSIRKSLFDVRPDIVVSAAAYTAVDGAENDEAAAFNVNARGPEFLAKVTDELGIPIIHISTDYVFSGDKVTPYTESDETNPMSVYGSSKLAGEVAIAKHNADHAILRTSWVYSPFGNNFLRTMLKLAETRDSVAIVGDQKGTPTSALDIADAVLTVAEQLLAKSDLCLRGVFHLTGQGEATWAEFAETIFDHLRQSTGKAVTVKRITTDDYPTSAKRPKNSRLSVQKIGDIYGIFLPAWEKSTYEVMQRLFEK